MARTPDTSISLSKYAFWYFLGYHAWQVVRKLTLWVVVLTIAVTAFGLIKTGQISGMNDQQIAVQFASPLPRVLLVIASLALVYGLLRATIATLTTRYNLTRQGIMTQSGWITRKTTIVSYSQIQKMTIVANPYDRIFKSAYIYLDLVGGATGISLEAIDSKAVQNLQAKLGRSTVLPKLQAQTQTLKSITTKSKAKKSQTSKSKKRSTTKK